MKASHAGGPGQGFWVSASTAMSASVRTVTGPVAALAWSVLAVACDQPRTSKLSWSPGPTGATSTWSTDARGGAPLQIPEVWTWGFRRQLLAGARRGGR